MPDLHRYSVHAMELGPMENFVYLIHDHASNRGALVDPAWDVEQMLDFAAAQGIHISDILLTHSHHDHVNGVATVLDRHDAEVHLLKAEADFWGARLTKPHLHHGGDRIQLGETQIEVMHTPGHTPGSACYHTGEHLLAGDTLFVFGCGRCDLKGGDPEQMYATLRQIRERLPTDTVLLPGHNYCPDHPTTTLADQYTGNPFLHMTNAADFVRYRMQIHDRIRDTPYSAVSQHEAWASLK